MNGFPAAVPPDVSVLRPLSGGQVASVWEVETRRGAGVLKTHPGCAPDFFPCEAQGLRALAGGDGLSVPEVWDVGPQWLLLEKVDTAPMRDPERFRSRFASGLAAMHRRSAPAFGWDCDHYLGSQVQAGGWFADWVALYRDHRLLPQINRADAYGRMSGGRRARLLTILDRLDLLLADLDEPPALIHGDLWAGNFLCGVGDVPVLIDPAAHYAPREMEMAYIELFDGFPPGFVAAYDRCFPLASGYARRRPVHQLYPLLIHLNHFGESYGPALESAMSAVEEGFRS